MGVERDMGMGLGIKLGGVREEESGLLAVGKSGLEVGAREYGDWMWWGPKYLGKGNADLERKKWRDVELAEVDLKDLVGKKLGKIRMEVVGKGQHADFEVDLKDLMEKYLEKEDFVEKYLVEKYLEKEDFVGTKIGAAFQGVVE
ncbi:hypothetical protein TIFTF001_017185 [Ficus carica]|uniref:Uncharacterized protein n=1 Tax=Ficus carica TaxID=3494 RepID=A0AA88D6S4_FICCA|nr:hypothetical protein TIFTF001_017185 [Ficus carica]